MTTMTDADSVVIVGVDTHHRFHVAAVMDGTGGVLATATFAASGPGYRQLLGWASSFGRVDRVGVEGTGAWGKGLARFLTGHDVPVIEVIRPNRQLRRRYGKSDVTDAVAAGRAVLSGEASGTPRGEGPVEALRMLRIARRSAVAHRTRVINQMRAIIVTCPDPLRERLDPLGNRQLIDTCVRFRPDNGVTDPGVAARHSLKRLARQHVQLTADVDELTGLISSIVDSYAPQPMLEMVGIGPIVAADLLITWGSNPDRVRSEAAFAALCGVSAVDASSGQNIRHRLNRGGDRQANAALHRIVLVRLRYHPETRAYMQRRIEQGRTKREVIRCLKRYAARNLYTHLQHLNQPT